MTVTENGGLKSNVTRNVVVYDPSAGFVTGSGWIPSPAGAYKPDIAAAGPATSASCRSTRRARRHRRGRPISASPRSGSISTATLTSGWSWPARARSSSAQFKGAGTLNGAADHKFLLTAIDGQVSGGGGIDRFRIKIWRYDETLKQDVVVYDNQLESSTEGTTSEGTAIGAGQIAIHVPKS